MKLRIMQYKTKIRMRIRKKMRTKNNEKDRKMGYDEEEKDIDIVANKNNILHISRTCILVKY